MSAATATPATRRSTRRPEERLLDDVDLDLVAALQIAPRIPVNALADVLASSPSTVARRLARLRGEGLVRVVGRLDWPLITTENPRLVWIRTAPGRSQEVARRILELPEVQTLMLTTGHADIYGSVYPLLGTDIVDLLTNRLPGLPGIVSTESQLVLRAPTVGQSWRLHRLTDEQTARLREHADRVTAEGPDSPDQLSELERRVLELMAANGRITAADIARELGVSRSTAYRTSQALLECGALCPRVEVEPTLLGYPLNAVMSLTVLPHAIPAALDTLGPHPSARMVSMVAGSASVIHYGVYRDEEDLARFITTDLGVHPEITTVNTCVAVRVLRRHWTERAPDGVRLGERSIDFWGTGGTRGTAG
ncbi:Lrp/AsnC family transcriptional regulator [Streptomyces litchfieldiae]|uniref:Lrp/AsnC family transcriptional regulator n=1 Tax=Streptomyces litchfieldiae TaxID=3075543 RepID=A0ABU2MLX7_9ACTN|nr:Lrp/AsnC family transcriptional regulator [Streptomyces sp. DSM 44938]MDT0342618.1 Lrp/AsnC family transcriptional regulator [Streptomyces sp. DSM 44938]